MSMRSSYWEPRAKTQKIEKIEGKLNEYCITVIGTEIKSDIIKAHYMHTNSLGCYVFYLDGEVVASYPISMTVIKSIK